MVASATAGGMTQEQIALALQVDIKTLVKHCGHELTIGALQKRMRVTDALYRQAEKGHVAAAKAVLAIEAARAPNPQPADTPAEGETPAAPPPAPAKALRLGKKEQQQLAAGSAAQGSAWEGILPTHGPKPPVQ